MFNEQQQQVRDRIKCPITREIMANLMRRAKDAPAGGGAVRPPSRAEKARRQR